MTDQMFAGIGAAVEYIESHLESRLDLDQVAAAAHYSKYHLHRIFSEVVGISVHEYVRRRRLTEAAGKLTGACAPILDIALDCGYESQRAFTTAFREMYKLSPAEYRRRGNFYPLQMPFLLRCEISGNVCSPDKIRPAKQEDIPAWMDLVWQTVGGYPYLTEQGYLPDLQKSIADRRAFLWEDMGKAAGILIFSPESAAIDFIGVHPQYRKQNVFAAFLDRLRMEYPSCRRFQITTYRDQDKADPGYRRDLLRRGFLPDCLLTEYGYPTQRFLLPISPQEEFTCARKSFYF